MSDYQDPIDESIDFSDDSKPRRKRRNKPFIVTPEETSSLDDDAIAEAYEKCKPLAEHKDIMGVFGRAIQKLGLVGEMDNAKIIYLAMTSRLLDRPVHVVVKGPTGSGKSNLARLVMKFFPPSSYLSISAMSDKALINMTENISHKAIVLHEFMGMGDKDSWSNYFMRLMMSEDEIMYGVSEERSKKGKKTHETAWKQVKGPISLITTTTLTSIFTDNETRVISLKTDDSPEHIREVLRSYSREVAKEPKEIWRNLQLWLQFVFEAHKVVVDVPYMDIITNNMPEEAMKLPRVMRDLKQMISLVKSHAVINMSRRQGTNYKIVADVDDYRIVRELVNDYMSEGLKISTTDNIRRVVEAVRLLVPWEPDPNTGSIILGAGTTITAISHYLGWGYEKTRRKVNEAKATSYIKVNMDWQSKGFYGTASEKIILGDEPLPTGNSCLFPSADIVEYQLRSLGKH